jgi:hypothetical protein
VSRTCRAESMDAIPLSEAKCCLATQLLLRIMRKPKVLYSQVLMACFHSEESDGLRMNPILIP